MFRGKIAPFAGDKKEAAKTASQYINTQGEMSFWTDGSSLDTGQTGVSVA